MSDTALLEEPVISKPETTDLFMSLRDELRLVRVPRYPIHGAAGQKVGEQPGQAVTFKESVLRIPREGTILLEDGRAADAAEIREWLLNHRLFGDHREGFWLVDQKAPAPSRDELDQLMRAAMHLDDELLERILEEERAGWGRADIVETAENALEQIRSVKAAAAEQAAAELAAQTPAPKTAPKK